MLLVFYLEYIQILNACVQKSSIGSKQIIRKMSSLYLLRFFIIIQMSTTKMIDLTVDDIQVSVPDGTSILQACEKVGIDIPRFCFHERLLVAGNCRMCLVEVEKAIKPIAACATPVMPGMSVHTSTPLVKKAREAVLEFLMINHPLDCPVCDQGGECDLQDQQKIFGSDRSRFYEAKRGVEDKNWGPLIKTVMTRCIHCTRCVRFATEVAGAEVLGTTARGKDTEIGTYVDVPFESELSANVIDLCPVGALTSKPGQFETRSWELRRYPAVDLTDAVGTNITVHTKGNRIMKVTPRLNEDINEEWVSNRGRFAFDGDSIQRFNSPLSVQYSLPSEEEEGGADIKAITWEKALERIQLYLRENKGNASDVAFQFGHAADSNAVFMAKSLAKALGNRNNLTSSGPGVLSSFTDNNDFETDHIFSDAIKGIDSADLILIVGANPIQDAPVLNARIRKRVLAGNLDIAYIGTRLPFNYPIQHFGFSHKTLTEIAQGNHPFCEKLANAQKPLIIHSAHLQDKKDRLEILEALTFIRSQLNDNFVETNLSSLQRDAGQCSMNLLGVQKPSKTRSPSLFAEAGEPAMIVSVGLKKEDFLELREENANAFIVAISTHISASTFSYADLWLPAASNFEKSAYHVNTEGRAQYVPAVLELASRGDQERGESAPILWNICDEVLADASKSSQKFLDSIASSEDQFLSSMKESYPQFRSSDLNKEESFTFSRSLNSSKVARKITKWNPFAANFTEVSLGGTPLENKAQPDLSSQNSVVLSSYATFLYDENVGYSPFIESR